MIVDTSVLVSILYAEPDRALFAQIIHDADSCRISVANFVELSMVVEKQLGPQGRHRVEGLLDLSGIAIEPVTIEQGHLARDFGKGRHKAGLNYGDCFAYALAKATGEPLLFKGNDFSQTDIRSAI